MTYFEKTIIIIFFNAFFFQILNAQDPICAEVKIEIEQELTLERQAFDAHMRIHNGFEDLAIQGIGVEVLFTDRDGQPVLATSEPNHPSALFFIRTDTMTGITGGVEGSGYIDPQTTADLHWLIIPAPGTGGQLSSGTLYYVGARLTYTLAGEETVTEVVPDFIIVKPMPDLVLDYFLPHEVYGDDAFTTQIEPIVPFSLGVRVQNTGFGVAKNLKIESSQPKIVENELGLLIGFNIEGCEVNGHPHEPTLLADFGDIEPNSSGLARWLMTCTLSGRFVEFGATFTHADELGGALTSLIETVNTHLLIHDVLVDQPGRDGIRDFLAYEGQSGIKVYESNNLDSTVVDISETVQVAQAPLEIHVTPDPVEGFVYAKINDPFKGRKVLTSVRRSDGKQLPIQNGWLSKTWDSEGRYWHYFVNFFDATEIGLGYQLTFSNPEDVGNQPPVLCFIGDKTIGVGQQLGFLIQASDPNTTIPSISSGSLPLGATLGVFGDQNQEAMSRFEWTPDSNQAGVYAVKFTASDGEFSDSETIHITVTNASNGNQPPLALDHQWGIQEDTPFTGALTGSDPNGDALTYEILSQGQHVDVALTNPSSGIVTITPDSNFFGTDQFTFHVSDGQSQSQTATVTVVVNAVNDLPTPDATNFAAVEDTELNAQLVATDVDGDVLSFSLEDQSLKGQTHIQSSGQFSYAPDLNKNGNDQFTYRIYDGSERTEPNSAHIQIQPVNDAPVATQSELIMLEDQHNLGATPEVEDPDEGDQFHFSIVTQAEHGRAAAVNGQLFYQPRKGFVGADQFSYKAIDSEGLSTQGEAQVMVEKAQGDIEVRQFHAVSTTDGSITFELKIQNHFPDPVNGLSVSISQVHCGTEVERATNLLDLDPGLNTRTLVVTSEQTDGQWRLRLDPADVLSERSERNNVASTWSGLSKYSPGQLSITSRVEMDSSFCAEGVAPLTGQSHYLVVSPEETCNQDALQGAEVLVSLVETNSGQTVEQAITFTDKEGFWHTNVFLPTELGDYEWRISMNDGVLQNDLVWPFHLVDCIDVASSLIPFPAKPIPLQMGPGGREGIVVIDDVNTEMPWVVYQGNRVPTATSGLLGGTRGVGQTHDVVLDGPELGAKGNDLPEFDAAVLAENLSASNLNPKVGNVVFLCAKIQVNDSYYGLPVVWQVEDPIRGTIQLTPASWLYVNGDLIVGTTLTMWDTQGQAIQVSCGFDSSFSDHDLSNNRAQLTLQPQAVQDCLDGVVEMTVQLPIPDASIDIRYGEQDLVDQAVFTRNEGDHLQWRLTVNGYNSAWKSLEVQCSNPYLTVTPDDYCLLTIDMPYEDGQVDLRYGPQNLVNGDQVYVPKGNTLQWRSNVSGFNSGWQSFVVGESGCTLHVTSEDVCEVVMDIPVPGAEVDLRYGPQNLVDQATVALPMGNTVQWRLSVNGYNSSWKSMVVGEPACILSVTEDDYCHLGVEIPFEGGEVDLRYGPQNLVNGDHVDVPKGIPLQWRCTASGFNSSWKSFIVGENGCQIQVGEDDVCNLVVDIPISDAHVDVRYGPQNLENGDAITLPVGNTIQWRLNVNGYNSNWKSLEVDGASCLLSVTDLDYCDLEISIPFQGGEVDLRYGPQNLANGDHVFLPSGNTIQWRFSVNGFTSSWKPIVIGESSCLLEVGSEDYCLFTINLPLSEGFVDLRYGPQNLVNGDAVILPLGNTIQWRLQVNGFSGSWKSITVGDPCELNVSETDYCISEIQIPDGAEVDIRYSVQNLVNGALVALPVGNTIQWRITVDGSTSSWNSMVVESGNCVIAYP